MNRRNVLVGLGALGIGGGALLGSGAFTSTEATREVKVNVVDDDDISGIVDVLVWAGEYETVNVLDDGSAEAADSLFPGAGDYDDVNEDYVSLIANNVTVQFGDGDSALLPNTTTDYDGLFRVVKTDDDVVEAVDVEFDLDEDADFLNIDGDTTATAKGVDNDANSDVSLDADVTTEESDGEGELTITITPASA